MKFFVEIKTTNGKGRGVFATKNILKDEIIEQCPIIYINEEQEKFIQKTILGKYIYAWNDNKNDGAIILGFGSIYNHSYSPNAEYVRDLKNNLLIYKAIKNILEGDEITVNYNGESKTITPSTTLFQLTNK